MSNIYAGTMQYNLIYIFEIPDEAHRGYLKIGEHHFDSASSYKQLPANCAELNKQAEFRIKQYTKTALVRYNLLHTELARIQVRLADGTVESSSFSDRDVHEVLDRSGFDVHKFHDTDKDSEWYKVDLPRAIAAIAAVRNGRSTLTAEEMRGWPSVPASTDIPSVHDNTEPDAKYVAKSAPVTLREEQKRCVDKTKSVFARSDRMLWDCKMRFGKTVTAYALTKRMNFQKVIVVTHRPVVVDGWHSEFRKMFDDGRQFVTKENIRYGDRFTDEDASIDAENDRKLHNLADTGTPFVYFASMQDLRDSALVGGRYNKNKGVFSMDWDLIIYDEAHEGTQTELGHAVQELLEKPCNGKGPKKVLQLSGTPYNLLNQYSDDNVFIWDYVMEQEAKYKWDEERPGDHNPYAELPQLRICTFDLRNKLTGSYRYEDENIAFNFREFFRTWTGDPKRDFCRMPPGAKAGDFVHATDVEAFLDLISTESENSNYPFSTEEYRDMFRHTFWILPGVKEARAFSVMLREHPVFGHGNYEIVNIAGEGDEEKPYDDALAAVREAIRNHDRTITLSCGRLTTGVTVKEWTGVMLLSGSSSTGAAGYMQTIFRVQSAGSVNGKQKMVCYAFDFAPDRALKVLSEVHKLKTSAVGTDDEGRVTLGKFLNFCPVLAETGTGMEPYDVSKMMRQLKKISVDSAIRSGFDDDNIYKADAGIVMDREKLELLEILHNCLTPQKRGKKQTKVQVNKQGLSREEYQRAQDAKRKRRKERTPEERAALAREKEMRQQQQRLFNLLRNISIRLPLLIFGTAADFDESIRLADFVDKVDDVSWREFMPKEVSKDLFVKLLVFYDEDVIEGAGMRIRRMAKAADELTPTRRVMKIAEIFSYFRNPAKETVLTPWRVVNMHMGDTIGGYNFYKEGYPVQDGLLDEPRLIEQGEVTSDLFLDEQLKILEMNSKSGLYPLYVTYSIYRMMLPKDEEEMTLEEAQSWWNKALSEHLFVLCQTPMAVSITKRTLAGYTGAQVNAVYLTKLLDRMQDKKRLANKLTNPRTWGKEGDRMKFNAVVGNPPYHLSDGGAHASAKPIYNLFVDQAKILNPHYLTMIIPARWYAGGKGLDQFRNAMLEDIHIMNLYDFPNTDDCFPNVNLRGGVCYFLWSSNYDNSKELVNVFTHYTDKIEVMKRHLKYDNLDIFLRYGKSLSILEKVMSICGNAVMEKYVSSRKPFGLSTNFTKTPDFHTNQEGLENPVPCYAKGMVIGYVELKNIPNHQDWIGKWKIFTSRANNIGTELNDDNLNVFPGKNEICTESYIIIGADLNLSEFEVHNLASYLQTKFVRFFHSLAKTSQDATSKTYRFVPVQDFTKPWTDEELYAKYGLTDEEISFIEATIKPME